MVTAVDLDKEELATQEGESGETDSNEDNTDGWVDEQEEMSEIEQTELDKDIQPIQRVLVMVSRDFKSVLRWTCDAVMTRTFYFLDYVSVTCTISFTPSVSHMTATCHFLIRTPHPLLYDSS
jgi:hypothetical protein